MEKDKLIEEVTSYVDKVFFYFIKRVKIRSDAEDLTQDTLLDVITKINQGIKIDNLDYYIFGVCKNKYNSYLRHLYKRRENEEYSEVEIKEDTSSMLDKLIEDEKILAMNKAIKLLSKDYAEILFAYYIEDKTIKSISENLNLPLGTVTWKLSVIRNKLKEYLKMERLNGKKAYVPRTFYPICSCNDTVSERIEEYVHQLLIKNLLYHSYGNPCSLDDYSLELGISKPYIEDYVERLLQYDFLEKVNNKYLTKVVFIDKENRRSIMDYAHSNFNKFSDEVISFCKKNIDYFASLCDNKGILKEHLMWSFLLICMVTLEDKNLNFFTKRKDGNRWDYCFLENVDRIYEDEFFIGHNVNCDKNSNIQIHAFPSSVKNGKNEVAKAMYFENSCIGFDFGYFIVNKINEGNVNYSSLTSEEKKSVDKYLKKNYLRLNGDKLEVMVPMISSENYDKLISFIKENEEIKLAYDGLYLNIYNKVKSILPDNLESQIDVVINSIVLFRSLLLTKAYDQKIIKEDSNHDTFVYNAYIIR